MPPPKSWTRNFVPYLSVGAFFNIAFQMQAVAVGWQVYAIRKSPLDLGLVGLVQFFPIIFFSLFAGQVADKLNRKHILSACLFVWSAGAFLLWFWTRHGHLNLYAIFIVLFLQGLSRAFSGPASQALVAQIVPWEVFGKAVAWNSSTWQIASIIGPGLGGLVYGWAGNAGVVYLSNAILTLTCGFLLQPIHVRSDEREKTPATLKTFFAGVDYVWRKKKILGAISLDLFAVLLGGATALLPAYASDILKVGPMGLGILRSAPSVGAALMGIILALRPIRNLAGKKMFLCVFIFGAATVVFGISTNFVLSLFCLFILGLVDNVSVVIRSSMVQIETPPTMRGRVSAVNMMFISSSNELGEFESGITAAWFGVIPAVVLGGIGTMVVAWLWAKWFPELWKLDDLYSQAPKT